MEISFDFTNTSYISQIYTLNMYLNGTNYPLICSEFLQTYQKLKFGGYTLGYLSFLILLIALPAPKFIGP